MEDVSSCLLDSMSKLGRPLTWISLRPYMSVSEHEGASFVLKGIFQAVKVEEK